MAIVQINYNTKSDINTTATPSQNKVSAADMNEIKSVVNTNATLMGNLANLNTTEKSSIVGAINELEYVSTKQTLLWQNTEPNADFNSSTITLTNDDYDYLEWFFRNDLNDLCFSIKSLKGYGTQISFDGLSISIRHWVRRIQYTSDTTFSVQNCVKLDDSSVTDNSQCVPLYVIGCKTNAF